MRILRHFARASVAPLLLASAVQAESPRVPLLPVESTWERLPKVESGGGGPLPSWARAFADSLPRMTAAMLDLDRTPSVGLAPGDAGRREARSPDPRGRPRLGRVRLRPLAEAIDRPRERPGRIRVPRWEDVQAKFPTDYPNKKPIRIQWSLVCLGYQPELALAWSAWTRAFGEEARQDRVFEESLFWFVTRQLHCFRGMGHCEMLLAVAGLDEIALKERTMTLAVRDWSTLPQEDRYAFFFAKKQGREPWSITDEDMKGLVSQFGRERSLDFLWWACRCHYMTRVADAFQIPLEHENVFQAPSLNNPEPARPVGGPK